MALVVLTGAAAACSAAPAAGPEIRIQVIRLHFSRFEPQTISVRPGETVRFVLENTDPIDHEFIVGNELVQQLHEEGTEAHHEPKPGEISVPAGKTEATTYTFPATEGLLIFGCHLPGHYAYGMRGAIRIG